MKPLKILETTDSPEITLDKDKGRFEFYGKSLPEDPKEFYQPVIGWVKEYIQNPNSETTLIFKFDYFNTASSRKLLEILLLFQELHQKGHPVSARWYYKTHDEDMRETGETFAELVKLPFKLISY